MPEVTRREFIQWATTSASAPGQNPPTKQELARELSNTPLDEAVKNRDHFAPLCDGSGAT